MSQYNIAMEIISKEDYLKILSSDRKDYFRLDESKLKPKKFSCGDIIHTIASHHLEDDEGNDIDQEIIFVNPKIITGKYRVEGESINGGWSCIKIADVWGNSGTTAHISKDVIYENYENSGMV